MPRKAPEQKPGRSEQIVCTPPELLTAIKKRLRIYEFAWDLAASPENTVAAGYYTEGDDALVQPWDMSPDGDARSWNWCNPPYADLDPWVAKAASESFKGAQTAMLVPASVGTNYWMKWVEPYAYVSFLSGRVTFIGHKTPYPKDLAVLLYTPWGFKGNELWRWK